VNPFLFPHIAAGLVAILAGTAAVAVRKGGRWHVVAGTWFFAAMLVLYFAATSWMTARRRDGTTGKFEIVACVAALGLAAAMLWGAVSGSSRTPVGPGPVYALAVLCLIAGLLDLNVILRKKMTAVQRISRHLWRMCFAFFIVTGSFFLGQQKVMPVAVRGSPILFVLAFAPFAVMLFWLIRLRFAKAIKKLTLRVPPPASRLEMEA
jgi:hypothetical protein